MTSDAGPESPLGAEHRAGAQGKAKRKQGTPSQDRGRKLETCARTGTDRLAGPPNDADRFLLHARALSGLLDFVSEQGLAANIIRHELEAHGLADVRADAFEGFISMNRFALLTRRFGTLLRNEAIGLHVFDKAAASSIGVLGNAVATAPDLKTALDVLCRYVRLYADIAFASVTTAHDRVTFSWSYSPLIQAQEVMCDRGARLFVARMQILFDPQWTPLEVRLQRPRPVDARPYRAVLGNTIIFDAPINMISLPASDLERPNKLADPAGHEVALALAERMMAERRIPDDLSIRAREDVLLHLADEGQTMTETARRLGVSARSLQRRLDEAGTTYQRLCDDVRRTLAEDLLTQSRLPIGEIAHRLGFANQANLTRASQRWFGLSPRQLRNAVKP